MHFNCENAVFYLEITKPYGEFWLWGFAPAFWRIAKIYCGEKVGIRKNTIRRMKTKAQKNVAIDEAKKLIKDSQIIFFVDFTGIGVEDMKVLRKTLRALDVKTKVIKKKLLRVAFEKDKIDFNPEQFNEQLATIFSPKDISEVAGPIYKFYKEKEREKKAFKMLGAYDMTNKVFFNSEEIKKIGSLPSREVLLSQFLGMLQAPIKMFMYVLDQKAKMVESK